jgi:hypothetical protein
VSALCADLIESPACAMFRRGKQARRYLPVPKVRLDEDVRVH